MTHLSPSLAHPLFLSFLEVYKVGAPAISERSRKSRFGRRASRKQFCLLGDYNRRPSDNFIYRYTGNSISRGRQFLRSSRAERIQAGSRDDHARSAGPRNPSPTRLALATVYSLSRSIFSNRGSDKPDHRARPRVDYRKCRRVIRARVRWTPGSS